MSNDFNISPKYKASHWGELDLKVGSDISKWEKAIEIFNDRIYGRFLNQINALNNHCSSNIRVYSGFTIMALDCLLIETLCQFYYGKQDSNAIVKAKEYGIKNNAGIFVNFFQNSESFNKEFDNDCKGKIFYDQIRCGLLHQAESKEGSRIFLNKEQSTIIDFVDSYILDKGILIRRDLFHEALIMEIKEYKRKLTDNVEEPFEYRKNFIKKMDSICRVEKD